MYYKIKKIMDLDSFPNRVGTLITDMKTKPLSDVIERVRVMPVSDVCSQNVFELSLLHVALYFKVSIDMLSLLPLQTLVNRCENHYQLAPIHIALLCGCRESIIMMLACISPGSLNYRTYRDETAMHLAAYMGYGRNILQSFHAVNQSSVRFRNIRGNIPLHTFCYGKNYKLSAVVTLVEMDSNTVSVKNNGGELALHVLVRSKPSIDVFRIVFGEYPEGAMVSDNDGWYPLHGALRYGADSTIVQMLLASYGHVKYLYTLKNSYPLHMALRGQFYNSEFVNTVRCLMFKTAVKTSDMFQWYPLHMASKYHAPVEILHALVSIFPEALTLPAADGNVDNATPCRLADKYNSNMDAFAYLIMVSHESWEQCSHPFLTGKKMLKLKCHILSKGVYLRRNMPIELVIHVLTYLYSDMAQNVLISLFM